MTRLKTLMHQIRRLSLLYIEDNTQARTETIEMLGIFFKDITAAVDGDDGIQKYEKGKFDLIITDIRMPGRDGFSMIQQIRETDNEIPIIIVTAHDETDYFTSAIKLGIDAYLLKPFVIEDLIAVIQKVTKKIIMTRELAAYKETLEIKVQEQVDQINRQNDFIAQQARLASMGEMINNIAHQWRQPLNRINSNVAVISSVLRSANTDRTLLARKITNIKLNTKYMSDTIEDFSNFFHPDKQRTSFKVHKVLQGALKLIESRIKGVDIIIDADKSITLFAFEKEYQQVLLAILNNAIDNFESKGVKRRRIEITINADEAIVSLQIEDNGGGIGKADIAHIFDPYYTTKHPQLGTGLGLYMAKMLVENSMGGQLSVKNSNGGASFKVELTKEVIHER